MNIFGEILPSVGLYVAMALFAIGGLAAGVCSVESFRLQSVKSMPRPVPMAGLALAFIALAAACWMGAH